jgi:hypothetical protein
MGNPTLPCLFPRLCGLYGALLSGSPSPDLDRRHGFGCGLRLVVVDLAPAP